MGDEVILLSLLPFIFWCLDRKVGARLMILFILSAYINAAAKAMVGLPRPFQVDPQVQQLVEVWGNGFPSGHTQGTIVVWGYLALHYRKPLLTWIAGILMAFVPMSRIYLGVHFPVDLLGGYIIGAVFLFLFRHFEANGESYLVRRGTIFQLLMALGISLLLMWLYPEKGLFEKKLGMSLMGLSAGFSLERRWVQFEPSNIWRKRIVCFLLSVISLFMLRFGLQTVLNEMNRNMFLTLLNYAVMGLWVSWVSPWIFVKLNLAFSRKRPPQ